MLFETIKIEDGRVFNLEWHNRRFNESRQKLFAFSKELNLVDYIKGYPSSGLHRCKIIYNEKIHSIDYFPYRAKTFHSFKIVASNLDYGLKYLDRSKLDALQTKESDEIIIEKDGLLTDTSIANIAVFDGNKWLTPEYPLLEGTTRARLLEKEFLTLQAIKKENLKNYSHFALMNSMIGFSIQKSINFIL
jgi:4-amino-4-deoxychorismate lyase